jgi:predicted negative regulator of RcsB-dependent stress response
VNEYLSEEEKVEALKQWWRENGRSVIAGVVLGAGTIFGWRYWVDHREDRAEAASFAYAQLQTQVESGALADARIQAQALIDEYPSTPYAGLAALEAARAAVEQGELEAAVAQLEWARAEARQESLRELARVRLARVLTSLQRYDEALEVLAGELPQAYLGLAAEIRGDIHRARGALEQARAAYDEALGYGGSASAYVRMKRDDLGAASGAPAQP